VKDNAIPNGAAKPDVEALLARIAQLEAQVAKRTTCGGDGMAGLSSKCSKMPNRS